MTTEVLMFASLLSPVILGLIEVVKRLVRIPKKYIPLLSLAVGVLIGFLAAPLADLDLPLRLWAGGIAGLSATGLFEMGSKSPGMTRGRIAKK
ncbi:holin [Jeotgalibacillus campisalis]|uniref:Holin n=1 Tax=Jeotgalibacillus campisalis TaxID=220754 RepID=A0A0C2RCE3_9BACL|nr:holin [Jeotgalibacillus campisalis]KIL47955.1 holin [Jeotgalibacillus campisalis]